jgi:uncharacterized damage-inducible protein DinB
MTTRRRNIVGADLHPDPAITPWLWALQDARERTLEELAPVTPAMIDWQPPDGGSTIGTVLSHLATVEADWLYVEVLEQPFPPEVVALLPAEMRDARGRLTQVCGITLESHLERLAQVRALLLAVFQQMDLANFRQARTLPDYDVTPEWVLHHLLQHEAEHRSQLGALRAGAERHLTLI